MPSPRPPSPPRVLPAGVSGSPAPVAPARVPRLTSSARSLPPNGRLPLPSLVEEGPGLGLSLLPTCCTDRLLRLVLVLGDDDDG